MPRSELNSESIAEEKKVLGRGASVSEPTLEIPKHLASVSVIIPTKNRSGDLDQAVESLLRQTVCPLELIVIDQSDSPESKLRIENRYAEAHTHGQDLPSLSYILDNTIRGVNRARNRAMKVAKGEIWLFLDDDVVLEPNFVEELIAVYRRYPRVDGVSGIITNYLPPSWAFRTWSWTFARGPFRDDRQPIYWNADRLRQSEPIAVSRFGSGLMSFRADAIKEVRFDESMAGVPEGDDVDYCTRLRPGTQLVIAPGARLVHKKSPIARVEDHWLVRYTQSYLYLYRRHWNAGIKNRVCFVWLELGCVLAAILGSALHGSTKPWRARAEGARLARR